MNFSQSESTDQGPDQALALPKLDKKALPRGIRALFRHLHRHSHHPQIARATAAVVQAAVAVRNQRTNGARFDNSWLIS